VTHRLPIRLSSRYVLLIAVLLFLFGFALRILNLSSTSLWIDDILTYQTLVQADTIDGFLQGMVERKIHVPAYFAVSSLYPGEYTDFSLRYPNVLWGMLAIAITMRLVGRFTGQRELVVLVGVLLVVHPHFILLSREARPYPMSMFFTTASSYVFLRWLDYHTRQHWRSGLFLLVSLITYLTHYATLLLIPAQLVYLLWRLSRGLINRRTLFKWLIVQAIAVAPTIAWEAFFLAPRRDPSVLTWIISLTPEHLWQGIVQLYLGLFSPNLPTIFQVVVLFLGIVGFLLFMRRGKFALYWCLLTIVPLIGLVVISQIRPLFYARYLSVTLPIYLLTLVLGWYHIIGMLRSYRPVQWAVMGLIVLSIFKALSFSAEQFRDRSYARREWREVMAYIEQEALPGDVIVTHPLYVDAPEYYQTRDDVVIMQPDEVRQLIGTYQVTSDPPYDRMWFIITSEGMFLRDIATYYGIDLDLTGFSTRLILVEK